MQNSNMKLEKDLEILASIIRKFLITNGGMKNGYSTWAEGIVEEDSAGWLKVMTPTCEYKTLYETRKLSCELEKTLKISMRKLHVSKIEVRKHMLEYGVAETSVCIVIEKRVNFI